MCLCRRVKCRLAHISTRPGDSLIDIGSIDIGAWFLVRDIDACSITIEKVEGHLLNRGGFRTRVQVAQGIYVGRAMIAHQEAPGLIGKASLKVLRCLLVRMMFPYDSLQMSWVDIHSLVKFLREVNEPGHRFASMRVHVLSINTSPCQRRRSGLLLLSKLPCRKPGRSARQHRYTPVTLTAKVSCQSAGVISHRGAVGPPMPLLFTSTSTRPK